LEVCVRRPRCASRHRHGAGIRKPSQSATEMARPRRVRFYPDSGLNGRNAEPSGRGPLAVRGGLPCHQLSKGPTCEAALLILAVHLGWNTRIAPSESDPCRFSKLCLLDKRMQRLNRGLPGLHRDKQTDRMRRQYVHVGDNPVMSENLQRPERQFRRNAAEAGETHRA
jgi:hypothetical protein